MKTLLLITELRAYLNTLAITPRNIGYIRRDCFLPWDSEWNAVVRKETAQRERDPLPEDFEVKHEDLEQAGY